MISWIQSTFQHHFRTVFAVLLGLIIISFVFTIGPQSKLAGADRGKKTMPYFGYDLTSQLDQQTIMRDAEISASLSYGPQMLPYLGAERLYQHGQTRVAYLHFANQLNLPSPTKAQLDKSILEMRAFHDEKGQFDQKRYLEFQDSLKKKESRFTIGDVTRVMQDDYRIEQVGKILGGEGHVLDAEVANQLTLAGTQWTIKIAELNYASFTPAIKPTDEQLNQYFESNAGAFTIPEKVSVDAVIFRAAAFANDVKFTEEQLNQYFETNKSRFSAPATEPGKAPTPPASLAAVRPQVEAAYRAQLAGQLAAKAASDFAYTLFDRKIARDSVEIDGFAGMNRGVRSEVPPFDAEKGPTNANWPETVIAEAFRLAADRYYSDPLPLGGDQVVLLWKGLVAAHKPEFSLVRDAVLAKYVANERRKQFSESGRQWKSTLDAKLAAGTAFDAAVAALPGAPKTEVKTPAAFTRRQPPEGVNPTVLSAIETMRTGEVSAFVTAAGDEGNGYFVQVVARQEPPIDPVAAEFVNLRKSLAAQNASAYQTSLLRSLIEAEQKPYTREPATATP